MLLPESDAVAQKLTDAERDALAAFRSLAPPCDTITAMWFIRANKAKKKGATVYDIKTSAKMYEDHIEWRKSYGADELIHTAPAASAQAAKALNERFNPKLLQAKDRKGRPVMYLAYGKLDMGALEKQGVSQDMVMRRYVHEMEKLRLAIGGASDPLAGHLQIIDAHGVSLGGFWKSWRFFMAMSDIGSKNYPELLGCACVVRGIAAGAWVLRQVKKFLDPVTAEKIEMHTGSPRKALALHLEVTDVDVAFTTLFEGSRADEDGDGGEQTAGDDVAEGPQQVPPTLQRELSAAITLQSSARAAAVRSKGAPAKSAAAKGHATSHGKGKASTAPEPAVTSSKRVSLVILSYLVICLVALAAGSRESLPTSVAEGLTYVPRSLGFMASSTQPTTSTRRQRLF